MRLNVVGYSYNCLCGKVIHLMLDSNAEGGDQYNSFRDVQLLLLLIKTFLASSGDDKCARSLPATW